MNDEELLELESLLESPEFIDELTEDHFHQLAGVYHRGQMAKITKKILADLNSQHDLSENAIKSHKDYPLYRHHADEAVRHHNACSEEVNEAKGDFHKEALSLVRKHSGLKSEPEDHGSKHGDLLHLHAISPVGIEKLHRELHSRGFLKQRGLVEPKMGTEGDSHRLYNEYKKGNTSILTSPKPNTFGDDPMERANSHHHVEIFTPKLHEEIVEMPDDKERFSKMMSPKLDDVLRSASKALAGKLLSKEEQLHGTFE